MLPTKEVRQTLARLRADIDSHNLRLLRTLEARGRAAQAILRLKERLDLPACDPQREQQMLARVLSEITGPYTIEHVTAIFSAVFAASRQLASRRQGDER